MQIQSSVSIPATSVNNNVIAGDQFEFSPVRALLDFGLVASATGLEVDVLIGTESVITRLLPSTANRVPIVPDDFTLRAGILPGQRIIVRVRNTTGGALTLFYTIRFNPV